MTTKRVVKSEDASTMPLVELAGRIQDEQIRPLAERLARNEDMQRKWGQYLGYRREHRLPVTVRALRGHLEMLAQLHPNPSEAYHALHWTMLRGIAAGRAWEFPVPMPKSQPRRPLPGHAAALAAAGVVASGGRNAPTTSAADLEAMEEYKRQAESMTPADRAGLLRKCSDTLPALAGSLAARISILNQRDAKAHTAAHPPAVDFKAAVAAMRVVNAETNPRAWHNRMQAAGKTDTDGTDNTDLQRENGR